MPKGKKPTATTLAHPKCSDSAAPDQSAAADVLLRQEPDEDEDEDDDKEDNDDDDDDTNDGYSE